MAVQTVQVVACIPSTTGSADDFCGVVNGVPHLRALVELPVLDASTVAAIQAAAQPFDYALAGQYFSFAVVSILGLWLLGYGVGLVIRTVTSA